MENQMKARSLTCDSSIGGANAPIGASSSCQNSQSRSSSRQVDQKQFEKKPRSFSTESQDFKKTIKYQDVDSYSTQKHHYIGSGLYNTDEIDDLPPRYQRKVRKAFTDILTVFAAKYPEDFADTNNPQISDILNLSNVGNNRSRDLKTDLSSVRRPADTSQSQEEDKNHHDKHFTNENEQPLSKSPHNFQSNTGKGKNRTYSSKSKEFKQSGEAVHENLDYQSSVKGNGCHSDSKTLNKFHPSENQHVRGSFQNHDKNLQDHTKSGMQGKKNVFTSQDTSEKSHFARSAEQKTRFQRHEERKSNSRSDSETFSSRNGSICKSLSSDSQRTVDNVHHQESHKTNSKNYYRTETGNRQLPNVGKNTKRKSNFRESAKISPKANKMSENEMLDQNTGVCSATRKQYNHSKSPFKTDDFSPHFDTGKKASSRNRKYSQSSSISDISSVNDGSMDQDTFHNLTHQNEKKSSVSKYGNSNTTKESSTVSYSTSSQNSPRHTDSHIKDFSNTKQNYTLSKKFQGLYESESSSPSKKRNNIRQSKVLSNKDNEKHVTTSKDSEQSHLEDNHSSYNARITNRVNLATRTVDDNFNDRRLYSKSDESRKFVKCNGDVKTDKSKYNSESEITDTSRRPVTRFNKESSSIVNSSDSRFRCKDLQQENDQTFSTSNKPHNKNFADDYSTVSQNRRRQKSRLPSDSSSVVSNSSSVSSLQLSRKQLKSDDRNIDCNKRKKHENNTKEEHIKTLTRVAAQSFIESKNKNESQHYSIPSTNIQRTKDSGFFVPINVSENTEDIQFWLKFLQNVLKHKDFALDYCCKFSEFIILNFEKKNDAQKAVPILRKLKNATKNLREPHIILVSNFKNHLIKPCDCRGTMFESCKRYFSDFKHRFIDEHKEKMSEVEAEKRELKGIRNKKLYEELELSLKEKSDILKEMLFVFEDYVNSLEEKIILHEKFALTGKLNLKEKYILKDDRFFEFTSQERLALRELLNLEKAFNEGRVSLEEKQHTEDKLNAEVQLPSYSVHFAVRKLKKKFMYECNSFQRSLPIYSKKNEVLKSLQNYPVLVISAETGSGKTTQLAEYLLQSKLADKGTIICTQPRKVAALSVTNFVCGQIGTAVGKLVGYDVGTDKKFDKDSKVIYMTDYALLKKFLRNRKLRGISCVIIDEAHERTLYTDLLLGMLKKCVNERSDLQLIITSATIKPKLFVEYFGEKSTQVIEIPGRTYPVMVMWLEKDVEIGWPYVEECVKTAVRIHQDKTDGDILVFLTSPAEIDEAIMMFKELYSAAEMPQLMSLHGKSDLREQLLVFQNSPSNSRKIIFATNAAETSLTIPGIKYVIDCGMAKELTYFPEKNKSCLLVTFINKSSAEQRKGRAGRTQPGICYRMYSKSNFESMVDASTPEILKTNLQKAMLKLYQFGIEPREFNFVESPPKEAVIKSLESLEHLGLIKETDGQKFHLTELGRKVVELPIDPHLAKLVLEGIKAEIGFEIIIMAALVNEAGRLFFRTDAIKEEADKKKKVFCKENGDLCTYLEVYKRWLEVAKQERYDWCVENFVNSKALNSATRTIQEVLISLRQELGIFVKRRYNNQAFKSCYERIIFNCFSENVCTFSGHHKMGYFSPYFTESLFIHPSSSLSYLKTEYPVFLVYSTLMQTSRNFLLDVTPIKEETLKQAFQEGTFNLQTDMLKRLQILPKTLGPFGESVLVRHIIGRNGSKIINLERLVEELINSRNFKIDVFPKKGTVVIFLEKRYHEKVSRYIYNMVEEAHADMSNEEEMIELKDSFTYFCIGAGGMISDVMMPGEFKEVKIENLLKFQSKAVTESLKKFGDLQSLQITSQSKNSCRISATYVKVSSAQKAMLNFSQQKGLQVKASGHLPKNTGPLPFFRVQVTWCRCPTTGKGFVEFFSEADCIAASGKLTTSSFYIQRNYIQFTPTTSIKVLDMKNLPTFVEDNTVKQKIKEALPSLIRIKNVNISRKKLPPITEIDVEHARNELKKLFSTSALIDLKYPSSQSTHWTALVYFKRWEDGEKALNDVKDKAMIDSVPLQIDVVKESHLVYKRHIYEVIKEEIDCILKVSKGTKFKIVENGENVNVEFCCKGMIELCNVHFKLSQLLQGKVINCFDEKCHHLFKSTAWVEKIQRSTKTIIIPDNVRKLISIFGTKGNCLKAYNEVCTLQADNTPSKKKVFSRITSCTPRGFLRTLYSKYGLYLTGLVNEFGLKNAEYKRTTDALKIEGSTSSLAKTELYLEKICQELDAKNTGVEEDDDDSDAEVCAICFDRLSFDFHRLENCGHAFCKECLLFQIEAKTIPLTCVKQDCGKYFYYNDIKKLLLIGAENMKRGFYTAALQYFINHTDGEVVYCPSPDCHVVFRVSSTGEEQICFGCDNVICTRCQTLYHYGMSCEMFQNTENDADYSLKCWMLENEDVRKQCPYCQVVMEKVSGCNHVECPNCRKHLCWLCLEIFPTSQEVYDHQPYCRNNQG